jgi:hypothetical protein
MARPAEVLTEYARLLRQRPAPTEPRAHELERVLESIGDRVLWLHDRRRPGSLAELGHLVITAARVWVVQTRQAPLCGGLAATGAAGPHEGLLIAGEDRTALVRNLDQEVALVRTALLQAEAEEVVVRGALCLVDRGPAPTQPPISVRGHLVTWPSQLRVELLEDGPFDADDRAALHRLFCRSFAPARHGSLS